MGKWKRLLSGALIVIACAGVPAALADDGTAELAAGGLRFTHTDAVAMVSEDLYLSPAQVRIRYVFHNLTNHDVSTQVAFPLPDISPDFYFEPVSIPDPASPNFVRFETRVDGQAIPMQVEQRAVLNGQDVTRRVSDAGLPLSPIAPQWDQAVARTSPSVLAELVRQHLLEALDSGEKDQPTEYRALWALRTAFYRTQVFPAGRDITVEQQYTPIVGGSVETVLLMDTVPQTDPDRVSLVRDYCVDGGFERAERQAAARFGGVENIRELRLSYVLTTGASWAGPIGRFHLTIDKGAPENLVSLCAPDIRRTSPTRFELNRTNFTPHDNMRILFLAPQRGEQP